MVKLNEELEVFSDGSTDVFKQNIIGRYMDRPKSGKFECFKLFFLHNLHHIITKRVHLKMITSQKFLRNTLKVSTLILL